MDIGILIENPSNTKGPDVQANYLVSYLCAEYGETNEFTVICKEGTTLHDPASNVTVADILDRSSPLASVRRLHNLRDQLDLLHVYGGNRRVVAAALFRSTVPVLIGPSTEFKSPLLKYLLKLYNPPVVLASQNPWTLVSHTYDHPDEQLFYIPNGFDTDTFSLLSPAAVKTKRSAIENRHEITLNTDVVIWVNHLTERKRPQLGIRAFEQLRQRHEDASFLVIGDGNQKATCRGLVASVPDAHYLGYIHHNEISKYFQIADVSLVTSRSEGFSNVIYESMASGLPVVTSTAFDQIGTGEYGRYLPIDASPEEIAEGIEYALSQQDELGKLARQHVVEKHSIQTFGDKYLQLYEWMLGRRDPPAFSTQWVRENLHRVQGEH